MWPLLTVSTPRSTTTTSNKQPIALMSNENQIIPVNNLGELSKFDEKLFEAALKNSLQTKTDTSSVPHLHYYEHPYMSTSQASTIRTTIEVTSKLSTTTMKPVTTTLKRDQALSTSTAYSTSKTAANASLPLITKPNLEIQISLNATAADVPKNLSTPPAFSVKTPSTSYQVGSQEISQHNISLIGPESSKLADKSVGAIDLSSAFEKIQPVLHKSSAPDHSKRRRNVAYSSQSTWDSSSQTAQTMIPSYFQEIFELVQTSLYTCTAAGVLIFFSSLIGICGGLFRVNGCLKFVSTYLKFKVHWCLIALL